MYGSFSYANNIFSLFLLFTGLGASSAVLQLSCENYSDKHKADAIFGHGFRYGMRFNIILSLIIFAFSMLYKLPVEGANDILTALSFLPILYLLYEFIIVRFRYLRQNKTFSYLGTICAALVLIASIVGAVIWGVMGLVALKYIAYILVIMIAVFLYKLPLKTLNSSGTISNSNKTAFKKIATVSMLNNASSRLMLLLDVFFVGLFIQNTEVIASYKVATIIPVSLMFIPGSLMMYLYPYFAQHISDYAWVKSKFHQLTKYFLIFNVILCAVLIVFAPFIIRVVFGEMYMDSLIPFRLLVLNYLFNASFTRLVGNILVTQRKLKFNLYGGIIAGALNTVGNIILIKHFGSVGAAISTLSVSVLVSIVYFIYFNKYINKKIKNAAG